MPDNKELAEAPLKCNQKPRVFDVTPAKQLAFGEFLRYVSASFNVTHCILLV